MKLEEWCRWEKERAITVDFFFNKFKIVLQEKGRYKEQKLKKKKKQATATKLHKSSITVVTSISNRNSCKL